MKKVKKVLSLIGCLTILFSLLASCAGKNDTPPVSSEPPSQSVQPSENTQAQQQTSKSSPWANPDGSVNLDEVGYYDPDYDYTQNETYKCMFLVQETPGAIHENISRAFEHWCPVMNIKYDGIVSSNGDPDLFLSMLQNLIDQGYRAFILIPDSGMMKTVTDIMAGYPDCAWLPVMAPARFVDSSRPDEPGDLLHPWIGYDFYIIGEILAKKLIEWKNEALPDVPWEEIGFLNIDASQVPPLHQRVVAATAIAIEAGVPASNIYDADTAAYSISVDGAIQAATPVVTTHEEYKYWLVNGNVDDFAQGAASVIGSVGLSDTSCIVSMGGPSFQAQSDAGQQNAWRYALATPELVQCEVFIGGLIAMLKDWATADTLWPMWVDKNDCGGPGRTLANMQLPAYWIDYDNYKAFYQWTAVYASSDEYNYGLEGITRDMWPNRAEVPAYYK